MIHPPFPEKSYWEFFFFFLQTSLFKVWILCKRVNLKWTMEWKIMFVVTFCQLNALLSVLLLVLLLLLHPLLLEHKLLFCFLLQICTISNVNP